jgi:glycerol-3-phosphate acyltransferase PlsY
MLNFGGVAFFKSSPRMILSVWTSLIGYIIGSFPTGFILTKINKGIDIRDCGSGSTGATNVLRSGGSKLALLTLLLDAAKGMIVAGGMRIFCDPFDTFVACFFCILGHIFPIWLKFKGGKGVSTSAGVCLIFSPCITLASIVCWAIIARITKISSLASLGFIGSFLILTIYEFIIDKKDLGFLLFTLTILVLILIAHYSNVTRIFQGKERPID